MKDISHSSRREFLEKIALGTLGMTALGADLMAAEPLTVADSLRRAKAKKFIPVMITSFHSDGSIDFDGVSRLTDFYLAAGAKGFFANCLSSEMYYLNNDERVALTRHVVKYINGRVPVVSTGSFGKTIEEKAEFTKRIYDTGVDAVILITSHFAAKDENDETLMRNFDSFFNQTGSIPLGTYECPSPYKRILTPEVFQFLVKNKRLVYHKDTSESINSIRGKLDVCRGTQLELYNAHTASTLLSLEAGANGMSPVSGNFYPEIIAWMCANANNPSKKEDMKWIQSEIARTEPIIGKFYPLSSKYFLQKRGMDVLTVCRSNSRKIPTEGQQILDTAHQTFLGWCERLNIKPVAEKG